MPLQPPIVPDWRAGTYPHGTDLNTGIRDAFSFMTARCVFRARQTTGQSIPSATWTALNWQTIDEDPYAGWSVANPSRYTAQIPGSYLAYGMATIGGTAVAGTTGAAAIGFDQALAGVGLLAVGSEVPAPTDGLVWGVTATWSSYMAVGDYLTLTEYQSSGGALTTGTAATLQSSLDIYWLSE
jgi:hypothetical protein